MDKKELKDLRHKLIKALWKYDITEVIPAKNYVNVALDGPNNGPMSEDKAKHFIKKYVEPLEHDVLASDARKNGRGC